MFASVASPLSVKEGKTLYILLSIPNCLHGVYGGVPICLEGLIKSWILEENVMQESSMGLCPEEYASLWRSEAPALAWLREFAK